MKAIEPSLVKDNFIEIIGKEWMLVSAGDKDKFNMMTASWGGVGFLWNKPVVFVFIRPERYTREFVDAKGAFTLSFLGEEHKTAHKICGAKSGRDIDKVAATGLTPYFTDLGNPCFEESRLTLECKTLYVTKMDKDHFMVVSPDEGALNRNMYYSSVLGVDLGMFYKRRDYSQVVNGRNPIVAHEYLGNSVEGKDVFIADDIISSGESMLDIAIELKKRNAKRIFAYATYPIFTNGLEAFDKAYADGKIDYVFGTNLSYRTPELLSREWFCEVDVSKYLSYLIMALNHDMSISKVIDPHQKISALLEKHKND